MFLHPEYIPAKEHCQQEISVLVKNIVFKIQRVGKKLVSRKFFAQMNGVCSAVFIGAVIINQFFHIKTAGINRFLRTFFKADFPDGRKNLKKL